MSLLEDEPIQIDVDDRRPAALTRADFPTQCLDKACSANDAGCNIGLSCRLCPPGALLRAAYFMQVGQFMLVCAQCSNVVALVQVAAGALEIS